MGVWDGDWARRIGDFARREGYSHIWDYLRAHPGIPLTTVADTIGDAAAIQIQQLIIKHCVAQREMGALIRDLMARSIRSQLPPSVGVLPEPYHALALEMRMSLLKSDVPAQGWLPESGDDEILRRAYDHAFESLSAERRKMIERGEIEPRPGDAYWEKIEPIWKEISIYDGEETFLEQLGWVQPKIGDLFAAHWCQSEVRNGGFHQFFMNSTGVLAPEAAAGFRAIGMPRSAAIVTEAMGFFATPYPRDRQARQEALDGEPDPFSQLDERFYELLDTEADGFALAADRYGATITGSPWLEK
jgi:hypothetical protein